MDSMLPPPPPRNEGEMAGTGERPPSGESEGRGFADKEERAIVTWHESKGKGVLVCVGAGSVQLGAAVGR